MSSPVCEQCGSPAVDEKYRSTFGVLVCDLCKKKYPEQYSLITKTAAMKSYLLSSEELEDFDRLPHMERPNPHKSSWHNMQLYLSKQVISFSIEKHGSLDGLERAKGDWEKEKLQRKEKKYEKKLWELRKKTRADIWDKNKLPESRHTHTFIVGSTGKRCSECGFEIKFET
jgi:DNA-repair protein complementing XP-A cells